VAPAGKPPVVPGRPQPANRLAPRVIPALLAVLALVLAACGEDEPTDQVSRDAGGGDEGDTAIDARETNVAVLGDVSYRVVLFRELNVHTEPDSALIEQPPGDGRGYWATFVEACNETEVPQTPTDRIVLENSLGQPFEPLDAEPDDDYAYQPRRLAPGECLPTEGSAADLTFDGTAVVFELPFDAVQNRPLVLELRPRDGAAEAGEVRIELDL
jgi:hypothetical protein